MELDSEKDITVIVTFNFGGNRKMAKRSRMGKKKSRRLFRKTAGLNGMHPRNGLQDVVMRGGIRL